MTAQQTGGSSAHRAIEAVWRIESARLIAGLARITGDIGTAEELAQDALVAALEQWPHSGVPQNAGAWLMTVGKRRAADLFRRNRRFEQRREDLGALVAAQRDDDVSDADDDVGDDLLRLIFIACHPVLSTDARVALTLR
ncbi:MAG: RNA polymerase subunit sigma-24, partial [Candidatus Eremiobacteraeota bacterium]|nr:RNA polymerase subunit sigma-24 [Candidatus Eremiobacteraeota bacterium]